MIRKRERGLSVFDTSGLILGPKVLNRITYSRIRIPKSTVENFCYQKKPVKHLIYNGQLFKNSSSINNVNNFWTFSSPTTFLDHFTKYDLKVMRTFGYPLLSCSRDLWITPFCLLIQSFSSNDELQTKSPLEDILRIRQKVIS